MKRRTQSAVVTGLLTLLLASVASCGGTAPAVEKSNGAAASKSTYTIPVIIGVTGPTAFLGKEEQQALQLYAKQINGKGGIGGHPIAFNILDDQSKPEITVQDVNAALAKHPAAILGPAPVSDCAAAAPLAEQAHVVLYCFTPGYHPKPGSYVLSGSTSTDDLMAAGFAYFRSRGWNRVAVIVSSDATGQDGGRAISAAMRLPQNEGHFTIVTNQTFDPAAPDVSAQMARIKASDPQVMIAWSTGTPIAAVFKGVVAAGLNVPVYTTDGNMTYAEMHAFAKFLPKELYIPSPPWAAESLLPPGPVKDSVRAFFQAFQSAGNKPDIGQAFAWDPTEVVVEALRKYGVGMTAEQLHGYLGGLTDAPGINGVHNYVKYPQRGLSAANVYIVRWSASKDAWVPVSGAGGASLPAGR